jgi:hypothetical protein
MTANTTPRWQWSMTARALPAARKQVSRAQDEVDTAARLIANAVSEQRVPVTSTVDRYRAAKQRLGEAIAALDALTERQAAEKAAAA